MPDPHRSRQHVPEFILTERTGSAGGGVRFKAILSILVLEEGAVEKVDDLQHAALT